MHNMNVDTYDKWELRGIVAAWIVALSAIIPVLWYLHRVGG